MGGHTNCTGESTGNSVLAIEDTDASGQIEAGVESGEIEEDRRVETSFKETDQESDRNQLACRFDQQSDRVQHEQVDSLPRP